MENVGGLGLVKVSAAVTSVSKITSGLLVHLNNVKAAAFGEVKDFLLESSLKEGQFVSVVLKHEYRPYNGKLYDNFQIVFVESVGTEPF